MKYTKAPLSFEEQADLLLGRGMAGDRATMIDRLRSTNYYRLSGYWYTFRQANPGNARAPLDTFAPGTTFGEVWCRYRFDRQLRLLAMDAIERIEVAVRTLLAYHHAHEHGPFGYATDQSSLPKCTGDKYAEFKDRVTDELARSKDTFKDHFDAKYGNRHDFLPIWMLAEVMTFGTMLTLYRGSSVRVKQGVADEFEMPHKVLENWLLTLNTVRNICAHHGRLWNREFGIKPIIPRINQYPDWHTPVKVLNNRVFGILTICKWSLDRLAPQSAWPSRLTALLDLSPTVPTVSMGFPANWRKCPIWRVAAPASGDAPATSATAESAEGQPTPDPLA